MDFDIKYQMTIIVGELSMKIICFDFGDARIGVANSDIGESFAFAGTTIYVNGLEDAVNKSAQAVKDNNAQMIVVGLPKNMDGSSSYRVERTKKYAQLLSDLTGLKVDFMDERLSTMEAYTYLNITEFNGKKRKKVIDNLSAQIVLQSYLDMKKNKKN